MKHLLLVILFSLSLMSFSQIEIEAESGISVGTQIESFLSGYSGSGYVTGFDNTGDKLTISFSVPKSSSYELNISYRATSYKEQNLYVNGVSQGKLIMPQTNGFETSKLGGVFLEQGDVTITIEHSWGYVQLDKFIITEAPIHDYNVTADLINSNSDAKTNSLWNYLKSNYGKKVISGQIQNWDNLVSAAQKTPKMSAIDFQNYSNGYNYKWENGGHVIGYVDDGSTEGAINWYNSTDGCGILTIQWHWSSPNGSTPGVNSFYTEHTNFSVTKAVNPDNYEYDLIIQDLDLIAIQLKKLENAGVPVLWRPLHEAGGGWFWWGAEGSEAALKLWDIVYDRLANYHNINNLIWVWSTPEEDWYPGNDKLDVFGYDSYPGEFNYTPQKAIFDSYYDICEGEKIIAMTENGPIPDVDEMERQDAMWAYFASWNELVIEQNSTSHLQSTYSNSLVITEDDPCGVLTSVESDNVELDIYPNPTSSVVNLPSRSNYKVLDVFGIELLSGYSTEIDVSGFDTGMYFIKTNGSVHKLIKE